MAKKSKKLSIVSVIALTTMLTSCDDLIADLDSTKPSTSTNISTPDADSSKGETSEDSTDSTDSSNTNANANLFTVTFKNGNTVLDVINNVKKNTNVTYTSDDPSEPEFPEDGYKYVFKGWKIEGEDNGSPYTTKALQSYRITKNTVSVNNFDVL